MTDLTGLIRSELTELADAGPPPADLPDRAVAAGVRRRRWRRAATGGVAVAATVAGTLTATHLFAPQAPHPAAPEPRNAVYASYQGGQVRRVLDPATGEYRTIDVGSISAPSTDLRYAAVTPSRVSDGQGIGHPPERVGRYDATTGDIRWYGVPFGVGSPAISPDGRYIVTAEGQVAAAPANRILLVDTRNGAVRVFDPGPEILAAAGVQWASADMLQNPPKLQPATDLRRGVVWRPDSRHFLVGNAIIDLTGRRTGTVPMPDRTWLIAPRPDGEGLLVVPDDALDTFALTDASGRISNRVRVTWPSCTEKLGPPDQVICPRTWSEGFLGWRGDRHLLVPTSQLDPYGGIDAVDVRTGERTTVTTIHGFDVVIVPADHLPPRVRDAVAF